jgi:hypothetical protein
MKKKLIKIFQYNELTSILLNSLKNGKYFLEDEKQIEVKILYYLFRK